MTCRECKKRPRVGEHGLCKACWKRLVWRPRNGPGVQRERESQRAWKAANPDRVEAMRLAYRGTCVDCGDPTRRSTTERCIPCEIVRRQARFPEIMRRWEAGESIREIAAAMGTTKNSLGVTIVRMRKAGWELPYRYVMREGKRVAA
jgi:hypothetical protein